MKSSTHSPFWLLRAYFRRDLAAARASEPTPGHVRQHPAQLLSLALMVLVFLSYPVVALWGGPVWAVSVVGAGLAWLLARVARVAPTRQLVRHVSLDILLFLWGVFVVVGGLREVGVVDSLSSIYRAAPAGSLQHTLLVGGLSALGSAVIDNHPMAILNLMALEGELFVLEQSAGRGRVSEEPHRRRGQRHCARCVRRSRPAAQPELPPAVAAPTEHVASGRARTMVEAAAHDLLDVLETLNADEARTCGRRVALLR